MDLGLDGKLALVGGASRGLGRAVAEALAREGAAVALYARDADALRAAADEIAGATGARVVAVPADVSRAEDCERVVAEAAEQLGGLDVLVTSMGGPPYRPSCRSTTLSGATRGSSSPRASSVSAGTPSRTCRSAEAGGS